MFTGALINQADAFVAAWLPGTQGRGVADVLIADPGGKPARDFTGRLPFAWPEDARSPIKTPLFQTGYGLSYAKPAKLGRVNQDPRVDLSSATQAVAYIVRGKVPAPWHLNIDGAISTKPVDIGAQEDARRFSWNNNAKFVVVGPPVDLRAQLAADKGLVIEWRVDSAAKGAVKIGMGGGTVSVADASNTKVVGTVIKTQIPLRCFVASGAKLDKVGAPLAIEAPKGFVASVRSVRVGVVAKNMACPSRAG
jgi:beta-glucosidase